MDGEMETMRVYFGRNWLSNMIVNRHSDVCYEIFSTRECDGNVKNLNLGKNNKWRTIMEQSAD